MAYVDDLAIGQIDRGDISPVSYCSPTGCFAGVNYESYEGQDLVPVYLKKDGGNPRFDLVNSHNTVTVLNHAKEFIINNYKSYIVPTEIHGETFLGFTHKLQPSELSNMMIAFDDNGVIPLEDSRVAQTIRKNHPYLKGSSLFKDGVINYDVANKSIAVTGSGARFPTSIAASSLAPCKIVANKTRTIEGGIIWPRVPAAQIVPVAIFWS